VELPAANDQLKIQPLPFNSLNRQMRTRLSWWC